MRQLRLVGIHENGSSLQVSSDDGMSFELPVDDALRSAMAEIARAVHRATVNSPPTTRRGKSRPEYAPAPRRMTCRWSGMCRSSRS